MSSWGVCFNWILNNEDGSRQYKTVPDAPPGAFAISGINSASYPEEFARINAIPLAERGVAVEQFYQSEFWNHWYAQLVSDDVAKRVLDAAVNMGPGTAVRLLQDAAGCEPDGAWGPNTVAAVNAAGEGLVTLFKQTRLAHYQEIAKANPSLAHFLGTEQNPGPWWIRSMK